MNDKLKKLIDEAEPSGWLEKVKKRKNDRMLAKYFWDKTATHTYISDTNDTVTIEADSLWILMNDYVKYYNENN